jgi:MFS family permease
VRAREKEAFGGIKFGSAFLGWLTTIGATLLLVAVVSAVAAGIGIDTSVSTQDLRGVGIGVAIALLVILFIAYFTGGYVAGRMARFNGARQGVAVWLWAVLIAIVLSVIGAIAGSQTDITSQVNLPPIPASTQDMTAAGLIGLVIVLAVTLIAAILGGLAGMRFHRRVDKAGFNTAG